MAIKTVLQLDLTGTAPKGIDNILAKRKKLSKGLDIPTKKGGKSIEKLNKKLKQSGLETKKNTKEAKKYNKELKKSSLGQRLAGGARGAQRGVTSVAGLGSGGLGGIAGIGQALSSNWITAAFGVVLAGIVGGIKNEASRSQRFQQGASGQLGVQNINKKLQLQGDNGGSQALRVGGFGRTESKAIAINLSKTYGKANRPLLKELKIIAKHSPDIAREVAGGNLDSLVGNDPQKYIKAQIARELGGNFFTRHLAQPIVKDLLKGSTDKLGGNTLVSRAQRITQIGQNTTDTINRNRIAGEGVVQDFQQNQERTIRYDKLQSTMQKGISTALNPLVAGIDKAVDAINKAVDQARSF